MLAQAFCQVHVAFEVHECSFGFDHPELRKVARGVAVLRAERGAEGVHLSQGESGELRLQLSAHGEAAFGTEEILLEVHGTSIIERRSFWIERAHTEHLTRPFSIARRNDRTVEIVVAERIEILVDAEAHLVAHAEHRAVGVGAETQVCFLAQEFQRVFLRLDGVGLCITVAEYFDGGHLEFHTLAAALRCNEFTGAFHGCAGGKASSCYGIHLLLIDHALQVADGAAIVEGDEAVVAEGAHPAGHGDRGPRDRFVVECFFDGKHADP